jgi:hypothetical protein
MFWFQFTKLVFVKLNITNCILNELGAASTSRNLTHPLPTLSKIKLLNNHVSLLNIFNIQVVWMDEYELPHLY